MRKSAPVRFGTILARPPPAYPGMRIGLVGGSFDPPHDGHRLITRIALARLGLSRAWWLVTPGNPLKTSSAPPAMDSRISLSHAAMRDARVIVTGFESDLATPYTAATVSFLKRRFRETKFVWIMGADNLAGFHRWRQWREIFHTIPIAVVDRPGWHLDALSSRAARAFQIARIPETHARLLADLKPPAWTFLTGPLSDLSSSALRAGDAKDAR